MPFEVYIINGNLNKKGEDYIIMLNIGIVGCGLQAATIASYLDIFNDKYAVCAVMDTNIENAKAMLEQKNVVISDNCVFFDKLDDFISNAVALDGIIIGTPCSQHADIACALEPLGCPLYIEKPVAITFEQYQQLYDTFVNSATPVEVSLPMRLSPIVSEAMALIASGEIGEICQVAAFNDVTRGPTYFSRWNRDASLCGGMFLHKAVHDLDYLFYLAGASPTEVCAMTARKVFNGDKPADLKCENCDEQVECPESPYNDFAMRGDFLSAGEASEVRKKRRLKYCRLSVANSIEDLGECIFDMDNQAQLNYHQNFFVRKNSARRGARFYGTQGTLYLEFCERLITIKYNNKNSDLRLQLDQGQLSHYGGDKELVKDFLTTIKDPSKRGRTDLITGKGMLATMACLCARESAEKRKFITINEKS